MNTSGEQLQVGRNGDAVTIEEAGLPVDDEIQSTPPAFRLVCRRHILILTGTVLAALTLAIAISVSNGRSSGPSNSISEDSPRKGGSWIPVGDPIATAPAPDEEVLSIRIALSDDGKIVAIGNRHAPYVRVYRWIQQNWTQMGTDLTGVDDTFGTDLALSGDGKILAIGGPAQSTVNIFRFVEEDWKILGKTIRGQVEEGEQAGSAVALSLDGKILAIGANLNSDAFQRAGQVRVFKLLDDETEWVQMGGNIDGEAYGDQFGDSISLSNDGLTMAVGARFHDGEGNNETDVGHVRIFRFLAEQWSIFGDDIEGCVPRAGFGYSVALSADGTTVAVGNSNSELSVYRQNDNTQEWISLGDKVLIRFEQNSFALGSLSSNGDVLAVLEKRPSEPGQHAVLVFAYNKTNSSWVQVGDEMRGAGLALSSDGRVVAVGGSDEKGLEYVQVLTAN
jgi:WD40 repeat protein